MVELEPRIEELTVKFPDPPFWLAYMSKNEEYTDGNGWTWRWCINEWQPHRHKE